MFDFKIKNRWYLLFSLLLILDGISIFKTGKVQFKSGYWPAIEGSGARVVGLLFTGMGAQLLFLSVEFKRKD